MNKKSSTPRKKLVLNKETVRRLTDAELRGVAGGMINQSRVTECDCGTAGCPTGTENPPVPSSRVNTACTGH